MDRQIVFPGQIPLETDLLNTNKNVMIALGKLAAALFGTSTYVNGLSVGPNSPAALNVVVQPGEIYSLANIDGTAYSSLAADTTHSIIKQGIMLDAVTLSTPAPGTAGQSINYLIQAQFSEVDGNAVVLPYYNASNPSQAYSGPNGAGTTNNTVRAGAVVVNAKAGVAATTGSQTTPAPDAGYVGLYVVTVANGQTTVTAGNISQYSSAPIYGKAALLNALNAFTQTPTFPTVSQFDNSANGATTAFVQRALGSIAGVRAINSATTLTAADAGKEIALFGSSGFTLTLPLGSAVAVGTCLYFSSTMTAGNCSLVRQGSDTISVGTNTVTGITINQGNTLTLKWNGSAWVASGESQLPYSPLFAASLNASGYRKLPSGDIEQWGTGTTNSSGDVVVTFPIAFISGVLSMMGISGSVPYVVYGYSTGNTTGMTVPMYNSTNGAKAGAGFSLSWRVIGK